MSIVFLTLLVLMLGGDLLWWRSADRQFAGSRCGRALVAGFACVMLAGLIAMIGGRLVGLRLDALFPRAVLAGIFVWHLAGLPIAGLAVGVRAIIARFFEPGSSRRSEINVIEPVPAHAGAFSRRAFFGRTTAALPAIAAIGGAGIGINQLNGFRVRRLDVPIRNLPSGIDGLTIAHVSDTHLGSFTTADTFRKIVAATNDLDADLVLQTGDLINFDQKDLPVAASLARELRGRFGQFMCEGNHDLIGGRDSFRTFMRLAQMPLLVDESRVVRINGVDVELLGLPWMRVQRGAPVDGAITTSVNELASRRSTGTFPILLAHHPHAFDAAIANDLPLTLSGHTHGGQLHLSHNVGFGPLMYRYWSGLYTRDGHACVVSNGVGNWFPLRVNVPAEILHLTLWRG